MTVADLLAFLKDQPPSAVVLIAGERHTFGDKRATAFSAFTYAGDVLEVYVHRPIIHEDDCEIVEGEPDRYVPVVVIGAP